MRVPLAIIPAGGQGARMGPGPPKCLREVRGEPIIRHVVRWWLRYADVVSVVVAAGDRRRYQDVLGTSVDDGCWVWRIIEDEHQAGVCAAVLHGLDRAAPRHFMVALGDCLFDGEFGQMPDKPFCGVAYQFQPESEWGRSYALEGGIQGRMIEKPLLGLGVYWLTWSHLWALEEHRGIVEAMVAIERHVPVHRIRFEGFYRNVTFSEDLEKPWPG